MKTEIVVLVIVGVLATCKTSRQSRSGARDPGTPAAPTSEATGPTNDAKAEDVASTDGGTRIVPQEITIDPTQPFLLYEPGGLNRPEGLNLADLSWENIGPILGSVALVALLAAGVAGRVSRRSPNAVIVREKTETVQKWQSHPDGDTIVYGGKDAWQQRTVEIIHNENAFLQSIAMGRQRRGQMFGFEPRKKPDFVSEHAVKLAESGVTVRYEAGNGADSRVLDLTGTRLQRSESTSGQNPEVQIPEVQLVTGTVALDRVGTRSKFAMQGKNGRWGDAEFPWTRSTLTLDRVKQTTGFRMDQADFIPPHVRKAFDEDPRIVSSEFTLERAGIQYHVKLERVLENGTPTVVGHATRLN